MVRGRSSRGAREWASASWHVSIMLWTIAIVLLVLWAHGLVTSFTLHGFIHILLLLALVAVVVNLVGGRRTL